LGITGSLSFLFDRKSVFRVATKEGINLEDIELELIDYGVDEIFEEDDNLLLYGEFESFNQIQKWLEENGFEILSAEFERIPNETKELNEEQQAQVMKLIDRLEEDDDVQNVFHNMKES
jgi:transcriptional/translational regulatory protein YebC/TACO1